MKRVARILTLIVGGLVLLCCVASALSALSNRNLPTGPEVLDRLDPLDKARLAETLHLKQALGEAVWPGWGQADVPIILWNHAYSFLVGYADLLNGWKAVPDDTFDGQPYHRQPSADPQNFAVPVGDRWAASMATKWETDAFLMEMFREALPPVLEAAFPYRLVIQPSEVQMSGVLHEIFHAYQAQVAPDRLDEAEQAHSRGEAYWAADTQMHAEWQQEIALLAQALKAESDEDAATLARQFLARREQRRAAHNLDAALTDYERLLEWEEGIAKYVELAIWREAHTTQGYEPLATMADDPDFKGYATFDQRWSQEIGQMKRQATREGETRLYYTGMAQAMLLDRLLPEWKSRIMAQDTWLETLLAEVDKPPNLSFDR